MSPGLVAVYAALTLLALAGWTALRARRAARRVRCALYHIPGPDGPLRIGITNHPARREGQYARTAWWWYRRTGPLTVRRWYPDEAAAHRAEVAAIGRERPPHNDQHNPDRRKGDGRKLRTCSHGRRTPSQSAHHADRYRDAGGCVRNDRGDVRHDLVSRGR